MSDTNIDHDGTDEVVCPHCGHTHGDSHEYFRESEHSSVRIECDNCSKEFEAERDFTVTYTTVKLPGSQSS